MGDDVSTSGIGDLVEAVKRGAVAARDEARKIVDNMRDAYARERARRALNLAILVGLAYLLLRRK